MRKIITIAALAVVVFMAGCSVRVNHQHPDNDEHRDGHSDTHVEVK